MPATAYILINVGAGKAKKVHDDLLKVKGIQHVDPITGPYDLVATAQGNDFNVIANMVMSNLQKIDGITGTITCNVIQIEP